MLLFASERAREAFTPTDNGGFDTVHKQMKLRKNRPCMERRGLALAVEVGAELWRWPGLCVARTGGSGHTGGHSAWPGTGAARAKGGGGLLRWNSRWRAWGRFGRTTVA